MKFDTSPSKEWKNRILLVMVFVTGFACWFFSDAYVGYPKQNERAFAYQALKEEGRLREWPALAASRGWVDKEPGAPKTPEKIEEQKIWGVGTLLVASAIAGYGLWARRLKITADDEKIYPPRGEPVRFDEIKDFDMKKWDKKGIAVALYERDGKVKRLVIDDWKYKGALAILQEAQRRAGAKVTE
jgi:hypothetical protein